MDGVNKGNSCYQEFDEGTTVTVEFEFIRPGGIVDEGANWTDGVVSNPRTFTINTDITKIVRV